MSSIFIENCYAHDRVEAPNTVHLQSWPLRFVCAICRPQQRVPWYSIFGLSAGAKSKSASHGSTASMLLSVMMPGRPHRRSGSRCET